MKKTTLLALALCVATALASQTTIVNYDFNTSSAYPDSPVSVATGITCSATSSEPFQTYSGVATAPSAFVQNTNAGNALGMSNSSGTNTRYFTFQLSGSSLSTYQSYKLYLQSQGSTTGATLITVAYSTDGTNYTNTSSTYPVTNSFTDLAIDLSAITTLDNASAIYIRLMVSGAGGSGSISIDNFQVQASQGSPGGGGTYPWQVSGNDVTFAGNVGIGMPSTRYALNVAGTARIMNSLTVSGTLNAAGGLTLNGPVKLSAFIGKGRGEIFVEDDGTLTHMPSISCIPGSPQWSVGGDNFLPYATTAGLFNEASIGTCNNYDFILKSNAVNRAWFKKDGTVGFGTAVASNTGGKEYKFHQGAVRLSGNNTYGGPQVVFDGGVNPYGDWGIEYTSSLAKPGLNFWKPSGSPNAYNGLLFLADDGTIGVGTVNTTARLTVDAWTGAGFKVLSNNDQSSIEVYNKATNKTEFLVKSNGHVFAREIRLLAPNLNFPDYVFGQKYQRLTLAELDAFINSNKHLPGFESAKYYETNGIDATEMFVKQQETIENLTLYIIEQNKKLEALEEQVQLLKSK